MARPDDKQAPPVALVTGATGGLGSALVQELQAQGWRVAAGWHRQQRWRPSASLLPLPLDVTSAKGVATAMEQLLGHWGRLDLLINNAGITRDRLLAQMSEADWDAVMAVHLKGAFLCSRAALEPMVRQRSGHIINIASYAGRHGAAGQANYAAAKAGLLALTTSLAREVGRHNVRVNAVLPGVLPTAMTASLEPARLAALAAANVLGRLNDVEEVARFVVFLAGLRNISGQLFQLDSRLSRWT